MTARWTAAVRWKESEREDRLFNDPWAASLAGQEGKAWIEQRPAGSTTPIVLRTRFFDDFLQEAARQETLRQTVLVGAGLDTRAFRLAWPAEIQFFELDQAAVLAYKEQILASAGGQPTCERQALAVDLTGPWQDVLVNAGFEPLHPALWLLEGFLFYPPNDSITHILDTLTRLAAPGSWLGFDIVNGAVLTSQWTRPWVDMQAAAGAPWIGTMDDPVAFLAERGWKASLSQAGQPEANHGRWTLPVMPTTMPGMPHNWFVTARKERC